MSQSLVNSPCIDLAMKLIERPSVTPEDVGCQQLMSERLANSGFTVTPLPFGAVTNFWARRGDQGPLFIFAGHTDVVPPGPLELWSTPPFTPIIKEGFLYGRGAADMKGSLAAMIVATENFVKKYPQHQGSIGFLITSDEEGEAKNGTIKVVEYLREQNIKIEWCIVGEPSSQKQLGDTIKNGRRGSINAWLTIRGQQGHVAYPQLAKNPIHLALAALDELKNYSWDTGNEFFPATSLQFTRIQSGTGTTNVIPAQLEAQFNVRFSTETSVEKIKQVTETILRKHLLDYDLAWQLSGEAFFTPPGNLVDAVKKSVLETTGITPELSTSGGTSDGRFIAPLGAQVIELGPINATIHQVNECVKVKDLEQLTTIYENILMNLLS